MVAWVCSDLWSSTHDGGTGRAPSLALLAPELLEAPGHGWRERRVVTWGGGRGGVRGCVLHCPLRGPGRRRLECRRGSAEDWSHRLADEGRGLILSSRIRFLPLGVWAQQAVTLLAVTLFASFFPLAEHKHIITQLHATIFSVDF